MKPPGAYRAETYVRHVEFDEDQMVGAAQATFAAAKMRRSVRDFSDRPVPREVIETLIATARRQSAALALRGNV